MSRKLLISTTHHRHKPSEYSSRSWCLVWNHCRVYNCPSALVMDTVNLESYINLILNRFSTELMQEHRLYVCFQQNLATAHTACNYVAEMLDMFFWHEWRLMGQLIPETSHFVFFFFCGIAWEMKCTKEIPTLHELEGNICEEVPRISAAKLPCVNPSLFSWCNVRLWEQGKHFQSLFWISNLGIRLLCFLVLHFQCPGSREESHICLRTWQCACWSENKNNPVIAKMYCAEEQ
jgi:hypothetical protein